MRNSPANPVRRILRRATIVSVAKRAGVSPSTVSFVLNGRDREMGISEKTGRKVLAAARVLNYIPDRSARSLRGKGTQTIGILWSFGGQLRTDRMIRHFTDKALALNYVTHIFDSLSDPEIILRVLTELVSRKIDGIILQVSSPEVLEYPGICERLLTFRSSVIVKFHPGDVWRDQVTLDRETALAQSVEYLANSGRRKLAILTSAAANHSKIDAIKKTWRHLGLSLKDVTVLDLNAPNAEAGIQRIIPMLNKEKWGATDGGHDSVFASLDEYAIAAMNHLQRQGFRIPEDVAAIGFNNSLMAPYSTPPLASIERRDMETASKALEILFARLDKADTPPQSAQIRAYFVARESAGGLHGSPSSICDPTTNNPWL